MIQMSRMFLLLRSFSFCLSAELVIRTDNDGKACVHDLLMRGERLKLLKKKHLPWKFCSFITWHFIHKWFQTSSYFIKVDSTSLLENERTKTKGYMENC